MINRLSGAVSIIKKPPAADPRGLKTNSIHLSDFHFVFPVHVALLIFQDQSLVFQTINKS